MNAFRFIFLISFATTGCITVHSGRPTEATAQFGISCAVTDYGTYGSFKLLQCNFSNESEKWLDVEFEKISLFPTESLKISSAEDINDYFGAYEYRRRMDDHNLSLILGSAAAVGAGLVIGGNHNAKTAGVIAVVGATAVQTVRDIDKDIQSKKMNFSQYGAEHLLSGSFRVPPRLFIRKTLLAETTGKSNITSIEMCFSKPEKKCSSVPLFSRFQTKN